MASESFNMDLVIVQDELCSSESALKREVLFNALEEDLTIRAKTSINERLVFYLIAAKPHILEELSRDKSTRQVITTVQGEPRYHSSMNSQMAERYSDDGKMRFPSAQRSQLVWSILQRAPSETDEFDIPASLERAGSAKSRGIGRLLRDGTFLAAYPLHESASSSELRRKLSVDWGNFSWATPQPIGDIKEYFGDRMALYFAWLGFYTYMLFPLSILGTAVFLISLFICSGDSRVTEVCENSERLVLCPPCDNHCQYTSLDEWCQHAILSSLSDNWLTAPFTFFVILWALMFQVAWKRYVTRMSSHYNFADSGRQLLRKRSGASTTSIQTWLDFEMTFEMVKRTDFNTFAKRVMIYGSVFAMAFAVLYISVKILNLAYLLRAVVREKIEDETLSPIMALIATSLINVCVIWILNNVLFYYVAKWLTKLENPGTQSEFDHLLTIKLYIVQVVSYYFSVVYVALFQGRFIGRPNSYQDTYPKTPPDQCGPLGCFPELFVQMTCVMFFKPIFNNIIEYLSPTLIRCVNILCARRQYKREGRSTICGPRPPWEKAFVLQEQCTPGLFYEYVEMIMQYGYVVMFAGAFPLAPLFAMLNNLLEIRLDGHKFLNKFRRPIAEQAEDIGPWYLIMGYLNRTAILLNGLLLAFGSDLVPRIYYLLIYNRGLEGYVDFSLDRFDTTTYSANATHYRLDLRQRFCRFPKFRESPFSIRSGVSSSTDIESELYWILFFRVAFLFVFENAAALMDWVVELYSPSPSRIDLGPNARLNGNPPEEVEMTSL